MSDYFTEELYAKDAKGQIRVWSIEILDKGLLISHGVLDGVIQEKIEYIGEGLAGRSLEDQILSRFKSRISKKIDLGYSMSIEDAETKARTNSLGFVRPMLATKIKDVRNIDLENLYYQHKLDGNRVLITNNFGIVVAYSRQGKPINTITEILQTVKIPEGVTIDGEIYCHGESLQTIVSWVKRRQEGTENLRFHAYDVVNENKYSSRYRELLSYDLGPFAEVVETNKYDGSKSFKTLIRESKNLGYEGIILRQNSFGYESKRSKSLIKGKEFEDHEFLIVGMHLSKDGRPMLDCITDHGVDFRTVAPGTMKEKYTIFNNKENIGNFVHLEFSNYTKDGSPFHPNALSIIKTKDELK